MFLMVLGLLLFGGSAWAGFRAHARYATERQLAQSGWCCLPENRECSVISGSDACRGQGGTTFNWDQAACNAVCFQSTPARGRRAVPAVTGGALSSAAVR